MNVKEKTVIEAVDESKKEELDVVPYINLQDYLPQQAGTILLDFELISPKGIRGRCQIEMRLSLSSEIETPVKNKYRHVDEEGQIHFNIDAYIMDLWPHLVKKTIPNDLNVDWLRGIDSKTASVIRMRMWETYNKDVDLEEVNRKNSRQ